MNFRSHYLESLANEKNKEMNLQARKNAAQYFLEVQLLQYNTLMFNSGKTDMELINNKLFVEFIIPLFEGNFFDQYLIILMVHSLAIVILKKYGLSCWF